MIIEMGVQIKFLLKMLILVMVFMACSKPLSVNSSTPEEQETVITNSTMPAVLPSITEIPSTASPAPTPMQDLIKLQELPSQEYLVISVYETDIFGGNPKGHSLFAISDGGEVYGKIADARFSEYSRVSPKLDLIAFLGGEFGSLAELNIWNIAEDKILETKLNCSEQTWSPDGNMLAIRCYPNIMIIQITETFEINKIAVFPREDNPMPALADPKWSPDGTWVAYYEDFEHLLESKGPFFMDVNCLLVNSNCVAVLKLDKHFLGLLEWSPDSKYIAIVPLPFFGDYPKESYSISIFEVASGKLIKEVGEINTKDGFIESMQWSPDGKSIAFRTSQVNNIKHVFLEDETVQIIFRGPREFKNIQIVDWITIP